MTRPKGLPEFREPPLQEVVLSAQFRTPENYQQIYAGSVWELFKSDFPNVEEHPALPPNFEAFGPKMPPSPGLELITNARHDRFWFLTESGYELIQFQNDRLLHNWRKNGARENEYPRFESLIGKFEDEFRKLDTYMGTFEDRPLEINQCEVCYINVFSLSEIPESRPASWFRGFDLPSGGPENFRYSYTRNVQSSDCKPIGRLYVEATSGLRDKSEPVVHLQLTVRGAPTSPDLDGAISFLRHGREMIVTEFAEITSERAQKEWNRLQ